MAADGSYGTIVSSDYEIRRDPMVVERFYDRDLTGRERLQKIGARLARDLGKIALICLFLVPLQLWALVTLDLPLAVFDRLSPSETLTASLWMSSGEGLLIISLLAVLIINRRLGARRTAVALLASWAITIAAFVAILIELAPQLERSDFPTWRFGTSLLGSWVTAQMVAAVAYDFTRGGVWWKAPFFGALLGLLVQGLIYFPASFYGGSVPWPLWLAEHALISLVVSAIFILIYLPFRRMICPGRGLGGR